ncbi:M6 family metalloprotease domain-containing protein, partial [Deltaproteobacteria bacterium TL4]
MKQIVRCVMFCGGFTLFWMVNLSYAVPPAPGFHNFIQPNGTSFQATLHGDEWFAWIQTVEGRIVVKNPKTDFYEYAIVQKVDGEDQLLSSGMVVTVEKDENTKSNPQFQQSQPRLPPISREVLGTLWKKEVQRHQEAVRKAKEQSQNSASPSQRPRSSSSRSPSSLAPPVSSQPAVVIMVEFTDVVLQSEASIWSDKIFGTAEGQLNHYWNEISYGQFQLSRVAETEGTPNDGVLKIKLNSNHPNPGQAGMDSEFKRTLEAADVYIDFSTYDTDKNGEISDAELQVLFIVAGGEASNGTPSPHVWAHASCIYDVTPPTVDGIQVGGCSSGGYSRFGERQDTHDATIGVIAHELGHAVFDLPDLYDTDSSSEGIGDWGLMGGGSWGSKTGDAYAGETPVHLSAWSKLKVGFVDSTKVTTNSGQQIHKSTSSQYKPIKILTNTSGEYFLVENRQKDGYDRGLNVDGTFNGGLAVWHVDDNKTNNDDETHKWVDLEEANNIGLDNNAHRGHANNLFFQGNRTSFSNTSTPNSKLYSGASTGITLQNISATGNVMTVNISGGSGYECTSTQSGSFLATSTFGSDSNCGKRDNVVTIAKGHTVTWNGTGGPLIHQITIQSGGTLNITGANGVIAADVVLAGGTFAVDQALTVSGNITMNESSTLDLAAVLTYTGQQVSIGSSTLTLNGTGRLMNTDALILNKASSQLILNGTLILASVSVSGENLSTGKLEINNNATITSLALNNTSIINVAEGSTLTVSNSVTLAQSFTLELGGGGTVMLAGSGSLRLNDSSILKLTGSGGVLSQVIFLSSNAEIDVNSNFTISSISYFNNVLTDKKIDIAEGVALTLTSGLNVPNGTTTELSGSGSLIFSNAYLGLYANGTLKLTGVNGTVSDVIFWEDSVEGKIEVAQHFTISTLTLNGKSIGIDLAEGKILSLQNDFDIYSGDECTLTGAGIFSLNGTLTAYGKLKGTGTTIDFNQGSSFSGGTLELNGGSLRLTPTQTTNFNSGTLTLYNSHLSSTVNGSAATLSLSNTPTVTETGGSIQDITVSGGTINTIGTTNRGNNTNVTFTSGFVMSAMSQPIHEGGGSATFTMRLSHQPTASVTLGVSSSNTSEGTVFPTSLTFTTATWNINQTVTVTGVDDNIVDGDQTFSVVLSAATSNDGNFNNQIPAMVRVTNVDNDHPGFTLTSISGNTTEAGGTATFAVRINGHPSDRVTIGMSSSDITEGTISASSLEFTEDNWETTQTITVTGVNDHSIDGDQSYSIILAPSVSKDSNYNNLVLNAVTVINKDDDRADFVVSAISGAVSEAGTATFSVRLTSQPSDSVTIPLSSPDTGEAVVDKESLTFTNSNWNQDQIVTVSGVNDSILDGTQTFSIILANTTSSDTHYHHLNPADVAISVVDIDVAIFQISSISQNTTETGGTATFTVKLSSQPFANVTIALRSSDSTEGSVSPSSLTFTPNSWNINQTVTVTGVDDRVVDGNQSYSIVLEAASSLDIHYNNLNPNDVSVINTDNDSAEFVISNISGTTTEAGGTATFTVNLTSQPTATVTTTVSSSNTHEGTVVPGSLSFSAGNWNVSQIVTVTGIDDEVDDGDQPYTLMMGIASSADLNYNNLNPNDLSLTNIDNDTVGITVSAISGHTTESGGTASFTIKLTSKPTANVTIAVSSSDRTEGNVSPSSLTFTPNSWNTNQTITVTGVADTVPDNNQSYSVILAVSSSDNNYNHLNSHNLSVIN